MGAFLGGYAKPPHKLECLPEAALERSEQHHAWKKEVDRRAREQEEAEPWGWGAFDRV